MRKPFKKAKVEFADEKLVTDKLELEYHYKPFKINEK